MSFILLRYGERDVGGYLTRTGTRLRGGCTASLPEKIQMVNIRCFFITM